MDGFTLATLIALKFAIGSGHGVNRRRRQYGDERWPVPRQVLQIPFDAR